MLFSSLEMIWGIIAVIAILLVLAGSILTSIIVHSRKIRESEIKFELLFNSVFDILILIDGEGKVIRVNDSACNLLGYNRKELLSVNFNDLFPEKIRTDLNSGFRDVILSGDEYLGEAELLSKNGQMIVAEVGGVRINIGGDFYVLGSFRDITERRKAQEKIKEKNIALKELLAAVEQEKMKLKNQIASTVDQILLPALNKMIMDDGTYNKVYYDLLKNNLQELPASSGGNLRVYSKLTPREVEICNLIKNGATSKDIANTINISIVTVNKHRERIRKKLVLSNKDINLASFLNNI